MVASTMPPLAANSASASQRTRGRSGATSNSSAATASASKYGSDNHSAPWVSAIHQAGIEPSARLSRCSQSTGDCSAPGVA